MKKLMVLSLVLLLLAACTSAEQAPTPIPSTPTLTNTPVPPTATFTPVPPTLTPTSTPVPTPTEVPPPYSISINEDGWQNYTNHLYRFSLMLPPDWAVLDLSSDDFEDMLSFVTEQNPQLGSFYTTDYFKNLAVSGIKLMAIEVDVEAMAAGKTSNLNLLVLDLPFDLTLEDYIELNFLQMKDMFGEDFKITKEEVVWGGMPAGKFSYELEMNNMYGEPQVIAYQQYLMLKGRTQYVLTFTTAKERTAELRDIYNKIFTSFELFSSVLYVGPDAISPYCDSWENACSLQTAIAAARTDDEIWVKAGVYTPAANADTPEAFFWLKNGVAIYGGFAGTETSRDQRDWETNITVLSGDLGGDDTTDPNGVVTNTANIVGVNAYHVVNGSGVDTTAILDGFVITAGYASQTPPNINGFGGGMIMQAGSPTLNNLVFSGNTAGKGAAYYGGGGMYISFASNPVLTHVTFIANTAGGGAGMYVDRGSNPVLNDVLFTGNHANSASCMGNYAGSSPVLNSVVFDNNAADNKGCMANEENSNPVLTNVTFSNNTGMHGAGMYNYKSSPVLIEVIFINNRSGDVAGGMKNEGYSNPILTNVLFSGNTASKEGGGMVNFDHSSPVLTNVAFINNKAHSTTGGGMSCSGGSNPILVNVTFSGNYAVTGGGLSIWQGKLTMTNVTFSENTAGRDGAAIYNVDSTATITNTIIWGNTPVGSQLLNERAKVTITHSIISGISEDSGNLNRNPMLGDLADNGGFTLTYSLLLDSPAIDSGSQSTCPDTDQRGILRPADGDGNGSAICDIGAYEYQTTD